MLSLDNGDTITNACDVASTLNGYFASIAETMGKKTHTHKKNIHIKQGFSNSVKGWFFFGVVSITWWGVILTKVKKQLSVNIEHRLKSKLTWPVCIKSIKLIQEQWLQLKKVVFISLLGY